MPWEEAALFRRNSTTMPRFALVVIGEFRIIPFLYAWSRGLSDCHGHRKIPPNNKAFDDV